MNLYPHQIEAINWAKNNKKKKIIFAVDMGLGKSAISSQLIQPGERVLVICPATLKINWEREIKSWSCIKNTTIIRTKAEELPKGPGVTILNYDLLGFNEKEEQKDKRKKPKITTKANYDFSKFDRVILDECHMIKSPDSIRSKISGKIVAKTENSILLSGTLMERAIDLYVPLTAIGANKFGYHQFGYRFCDPQLVDIGRRQIWMYRGLSNEEELKALMQHQVLVMKKGDIPGLKLPKKQIKVVALDLPVDAREKRYNLSDIKKDPRPIGFEGLSELLHMQGLLKVADALSHIEMRLESMDKIFVTAKHSEVIDLLYAGLKKYNPVILDGRRSLKKKQEAIDTFQTDPKCRVIIGQNKTADKGATLTAANHIVIVEPDWSFSTLMQLIDRCHRIGATSETVTAELLTIANSICERVLWTTLKKEGYINALGL